jgi:signal transduction histidine kinase
VTESAPATVRRASTRAGVEQTLAWGIAGVRAFDLAQAVVALATGSLSRATNPTLDGSLFGLVFGESILLGRWLVRRRSVRQDRWPVAMDFVVGMLAVGLTVAYAAPADRLGVWIMWPYPLTLSTVVFVGVTLHRLRWVLACSGILAGTYVTVVALPLAGDAPGQATAVANVLAYPGFALVAYLFARLVRKLAETADTAKARVAELERERSKAYVHRLLPYLRLDRFAEADDDARAAMVARAQEQHQRMRAYVDDAPDARNVEAQVRAVLELHRGLNIDLNIDLETGVELPTDMLESLHLAVDTALANVEQHAPNSTVVVTARSTPETIEVTVCDDGPGFDQAQIRPGFGIAKLLGQQLAAIGGEGLVASVPGQGTNVRITIPRTQP